MKKLNIYTKGCTSGKSTVINLHCPVGNMEKTLIARKISLSAFIDIKKAFDNASLKLSPNILNSINAKK